MKTLQNDLVGSPHNTTDTTNGQITRYGVEWSNDGARWLAIVNDKSLPEAQAHFRANTANYKRLVKHEIVKTILELNPKQK